MKRIPLAFQLLNHRITVQVIPQSQWHYEHELGWWDPNKNQILLMRQPRSQLRHVFWHEVTHALLELMGHTKLSSNEAFVDQMGGLLAQLMDSAEF